MGLIAALASSKIQASLVAPLVLSSSPALAYQLCHGDRVLALSGGRSRTPTSAPGLG
jgi:hypothetical protein